MALDVVETIEAQNSLEKMLAHQLAAAHQASMAMTAQLNRCIENMEHHDPDARERANIQGTRLARPTEDALGRATLARILAGMAQEGGRRDEAEENKAPPAGSRQHCRIVRP